jgi:hypothetical protein
VRLSAQLDLVKRELSEYEITYLFVDGIAELLDNSIT